MTLSIKTIASAIALSAIMAGNAFAMVPQADLNRAVGSAVSGGSNVLVTIQGDTVTLTGTVADAGDANAAKRAAMNFAGVDRVFDNTFRSN